MQPVPALEKTMNKFCIKTILLYFKVSSTQIQGFSKESAQLFSFWSALYFYKPGNIALLNYLISRTIYNF